MYDRYTRVASKFHKPRPTLNWSLLVLHLPPFQSTCRVYPLGAVDLRGQPWYSAAPTALECRHWTESDVSVDIQWCHHAVGLSILYKSFLYLSIRIRAHVDTFLIPVVLVQKAPSSLKCSASHAMIRLESLSVITKASNPTASHRRVCPSVSGDL